MTYPEQQPTKRSNRVCLRDGAMVEIRRILKPKSETHLADMIGVSRETLRLVESGERGASGAFIAGVCLATREASISRWFKVSET
ncbi:hypothetical protein [Nocardia cyriacigeorgica]|uniref:hypothetical protein n=1 Tax=Nocardia cyriacigeorgica TaxID=135487 RepID=UPI0013D1B670|nr:hypothetical protein [Nocardia cyriacigeorgica]NEW29707.1 hypothetical protein [Nocardia cyriacigeorgica]